MTESYSANRRADDGGNCGGIGLGATVMRAVFFVLSCGLGLVLMEVPWSDGLPAMDASYLAANFAIVALLGAVAFFAGQRTRASLAVFVGLCLLVGVANFFIIEFKGQPIVPADLFALSTAASVASGYSLFMTPRLALCLAVYIVYCVALVLLCPKRKITARGVALNCVMAVALAGFGAMEYNTTDIKQAASVNVDVWDVRGSYSTQGTALCFLSRAQELTPKPPEGYSDEALADILGSTTDDDAEGAATNNGASDGPNVIAIMNETFSDLSTYPGLADSNAAPAFFHEVADDSLVAGDVYVSAMGGGTCNSEFEFLTGASMGNMGGGVYPYVLYDLEGVDNLASYFRGLGYGTHAIHPAEASNWRRDRIYAQLGFDTFDDITTMEGADTFRDLVTDRATYERALQKIDTADEPQFVFDVTIQNHGGYDTGLVPPADAVHLESDEVENPEVDEFLAAIKRSDEDLRWLVNELNARDEPTIVVFFGDHQPGFADWLFERTYGKPVEDATAEEVQQRYCTPYFVWANGAARAQYGDRLKKIEDADVTSLNYLAALLCEAAGLPETPRSRWLGELREALPVVNLNGYRDAEGGWHWFGEDAEGAAQAQAEEALKSYGIVQYDQLFGDHSNR